MLERLANGWGRFCGGLSPGQKRLIGLVGVYLTFYLLLNSDALSRSFLCGPLNNLNVSEAESWLTGRLDLDAGTGLGRRPWDTAVYNGRVYNVFPPLFTLIAAAVMAVGPPGVPSYLLILLFALPIPGLAYVLFLRRTQRVRMAVLLTAGYLLGTSLLPEFQRGLGEGEVWHVNHLLSQVGLLIFLVEYFGARRVWVAGIGVIIAAWSRQLTGLYLVPLAWMALKGGSCRGVGTDDPPYTSPELAEAVRAFAEARPSTDVLGTAGAAAGYWDPLRQRVVQLAVVAVVMAALPAVLNTLKFGRPWEAGYCYVYEGRDDETAQDARKGLFSPTFLPRNLYYMNLGFPLPELRGGWVLRFVPNAYGTGIWWTSPVLLYVLLLWRRLWRQAEVRWLLAAAGGIYGVLLFYHNTGYAQMGYNRFSLDYVAVLLAAIAPLCDQERRWWTFWFVLWSVWYFRWGVEK